MRVRSVTRPTTRGMLAGAMLLALLTALAPVAPASADGSTTEQGTAFSLGPERAERLGAPGPAEAERYLVVMRPPTVRERLGGLARGTIRVDLAQRAAGAVEAAAGVPRRDLTRLMGAVSADLDAAALARLERDPRVSAIIPNVPVEAFDRRVATRQQLPLTGLLEPEYLWGLDRIDRADPTGDREYRFTTTGAGVDVYVLDTGIRFVHDDFLDAAGSSRILPASTFTGGHYDATYFYDISGTVFAAPAYQRAQDCQLHGAHVAGTAVGRSSGVAKGARVVPVKVFPLCALGTNFIEDILDGMQWVLDNRRAGVPAVVNMSLGSSFSTLGAFPELDAAVDALVDDGIVVVAAAGNSDKDACLSWPARVPSAITVGATTSAGERSSFSNHGTCVDVFAPGSDIDSTCALIKVVDGSVFLTQDGLFVHRDDCTTSSTIRIGGTSMAAPLVAGLAARHLQRAPQATPAQVASAILAGALSGTEASPLVADRKAGSPDLLASALFLEGPGPQGTDPAPVPAVVVCAGTESTSSLQQLPATGIAPLTWTVVDGELPGSLALSLRGRLTGSGSAASGSVTVRVEDAFGRAATWMVPRSSLPVGCVED